MALEQDAQELLAWEFDAYEDHERGVGWYLLAGLIVVGLLIAAFVTRNFLFAVMIVMLVGVYYLRHANRPSRVRCVIAEDGITVDDRHFAFDDVDEFAVLTPPRGRAMLYLNPSGWRLRMHVPIEGVDPEDVRALLAPRVTERKDQDESGGEIVSKLLRL
ncbi:MAG: hypothetical protein Q7T01_01640 [bacterium]|nr:hypothetical protein [bacterium]